MQESQNSSVDKKVEGEAKESNQDTEAEGSKDAVDDTDIEEELLGEFIFAEIDEETFKKLEYTQIYEGKAE